MRLRNRIMSPPTPTTRCLPPQTLRINRRRVDLSFDAPDTSSDGGLVLLRQVDDALGLTARFAALLPDERAQHMVIHSRHEQLRQRVFGIALGWEDQDDARTLRHDPLLQLACDRSPFDEKGLSSQPTLSRLEHAASARDVVRLQRELEAEWVDSLPDDTTVVVLDMDATDDPTHGQQPLAFFHGHYNQRIYYPLLVFDGDGRLASVRLRPGNAGNFRYATPLLARLVRRVKGRFPAAQIVVRADGGFCSTRLFEALEALDAELGDVDFLVGTRPNPKLIRNIESELTIAREASRAGVPARVFASFRYRAKTWKRERRILAKAEQLGDKPNPRFVVTSLDHLPPRLLYENGYCARGDAENRIKDFKNALAGDRLSCTTYVANALRLVLHAFAYRLMDALRGAIAPVAPQLGRAQFDTIRLKLLKVAAVVRESVRRVTISLPKAFPLATAFAQLVTSLRTVPPAAPALPVP